jgi:two-component system, cell cycle sensor histidine kinase and response regulator CckA
VYTLGLRAGEGAPLAQAFSCVHDMKPPDSEQSAKPEQASMMDDAVSVALEFFEMSLDNLCVSGLDGYFKRLSPSWTRTLGWSPEELMARPSIDFVHPEDRQATLSARSQLGVGVPLLALVNRYQCKDGSYRWFEWRSVARVDRGLVYGIARDVTAQKEAERVLREAKDLQERLQSQLIFADRMASVGTLAAGVAHEINNPLAFVMGNLDMLLEEIRTFGTVSFPAQMAEWAEMVLVARQGTERIGKIVRGLKTFSRAEEERRTVIDLYPVLEVSIDLTFGEIRHRARLVKDYGVTPLVEADDARLGQVFINLLVNAAQALPEGAAESNEIRIVTSTDAAGRAVIEIRDTGSGIPASVIGRVFDPFFTTKPIGVGTGLGLSICHSIVTSMGGEITVKSDEGHGTIFRVALPAAPAGHLQQVTAAPTKQKSTLRRAAVLVVDDEPAVGVVLGRLLQDHDVTVVTTAKEALDLLVSDRFDIVLSDLMMPGMSGMDLYDELVRRGSRAAARMVFITGGAFTPAAKAFLDRVSNIRIDKPFGAEVVRDLVQKVMN